MKGERTFHILKSGLWCGMVVTGRLSSSPRDLRGAGTMRKYSNHETFPDEFRE